MSLQALKNQIPEWAAALGFSATGQFKRSDFGLGAWIPAVSDDVILDIEAEFVRRDAK